MQVTEQVLLFTNHKCLYIFCWSVGQCMNSSLHLYAEGTCFEYGPNTTVVLTLFQWLSPLLQGTADTV